MNTLKYLILFFLGFAHSSYGVELESECTDAGYTFIKNVTIQFYNINSDKQLFSIRTSNSTKIWYEERLDTPAGRFLFDMVKTARLTGDRVNICVSPHNNNWLVGVAWTDSVN